MLKKLQEKYSKCNNCKRCMYTRKVFGWGNPDADIVVVGEGPGREEAKEGIPFVGPAGELLDKMLGAIQLERKDLYYTNTIICRTNEKDRTPSLEEMQNCAARLDEELEIVKPNIILMVGSCSLKRFFGNDSKVIECHGRWFLDFKPPYARYFSMYHPSWALHSTTEGEFKLRKRTLWEDAKLFKEGIETINFKIRRNEDV